jgi:hypothetical protein
MQGDSKGGRKDRGCRELSVIKMRGRSGAVVSYHGLARDCRNERREGLLLAVESCPRRAEKGAVGLAIESYRVLLPKSRCEGRG